ncbi:MAG TPA: ABC transporter permease [Bryobacteraceae bacterium]|nr:ABC transporter permease [Bryobacteraceae bacterium]
MPWVRRFANHFHRKKLQSEIDEELASHLEEAIERGRDAAAARRALGAPLRHREQSMDLRLLPWLDALASDILFGWRQLRKHRVASGAAILSLALAIGATTSAFRLVDAVLLRPLPVSEPGRLFFLAVTEVDPHDGHLAVRDDSDYPTFRKRRDQLADRADVMLVGFNAPVAIILNADNQPNQVYRQFLSGNVFAIFGLVPAAGRLLAPDDDSAPGAHPYAVLSHDFWSRRFGRDPSVVGKTFRMGRASYQIIGVAPKGFTGTEPGKVTDIFLPATMNVDALDSTGWSWFRIWVRPKAGFSRQQVAQPLQAELSRSLEEFFRKTEATTPRAVVDAYRKTQVMLLPADAGASELQNSYRRPLLILTVLVALVLLIACANVGNLLIAQAASRAREMALRVSIGAGKARLIQLMLVESALLAAIASFGGALFSWWSAPLVVSMLAPEEQPVRLILNADWRLLGFGFALTAAVITLFGLAPALRASSVKPMSALKGGADPQSRRGFMQSMITLQVAFCVLVLFGAGLFASTFDRLSHRPLGFSPAGVLDVKVESRGGSSSATWQQVVDHLREVDGVEAVANASWEPLSDNRWTGSVRVPGHPESLHSPFLLDVSPGYFSTLKIGLIDGREFRSGDVHPKLVGDNQPVAGSGIVNEAFARMYFDGSNPVGKTIGVREGKDLFAEMTIVGYVRDACYNSVREVVPPTVYFPVEDKGAGTFLVRSNRDVRVLTPILRREISQARADLGVRSIHTQDGVVIGQMVRERLLATISLFFAIVAVVLAGVGLYGVLNFSVTLQRREIGIRMTLGARPGQVVHRITSSIAGLVCLGVAIGLAAGLACQHFVEALLFEVKGNDPASLTKPLAMILGVAVLAAVPPAVRAVQTDPAQTLRSE